MRILFLRAYDFPLGGAPQNRLLGICQGLIEQGHFVEVHQYTPAKLDLKQNHLKEQRYKSVKIYNHAWKWSPISSKFGQFCGIIFGTTNTIRAIFKAHQKDKIDHIFINSERNLFLLIFFIIARLIRADIGRDLNEYPLTVLKPENFTGFVRKYKMKTNYIWFDFLFVISENLGEFYRPFVRKNTRFLYLPVTVDFGRFPYPVKDLSNKFISYCGDLSRSKDGIFILVNAFACIANDFPDTYLKLIGQNKNISEMNTLNRLISSLNLDNRVIQKGYINPEKVPEQLYKSCLLVLSRPDNIQAKGGFPTKLAEYLATGVPVAVTSVGEIPKFLHEDENAFLADPNSIDSFASAMRKALLNEKESFLIGKKGRETALKMFSHSVQGKIISDFLSKKQE